MILQISFLLALLALSINITVLATVLEKRTYTFKKVCDENIQLDVEIPPSSPYSKYPVFFAYHGGGFVNGGKGDAYYAAERENIMSRGWLGVAVNYRLCPGSTLDEGIEDIIDAYDWVRYNLSQTINLDADKFIMFGGSTGAAMALISGYAFNPTPKVVISFYAFSANFTDPKIFYDPVGPIPNSYVKDANAERDITSQTGEWSKWLLFIKGQANHKLGWLLSTDDPNASPEFIQQKMIDYSAVSNVEEDYPATWLGHGTNDTTISHENTVQLAVVLEEKGIPYKLDLVPGADHVYDVNFAHWTNHVLPALKGKKPSRGAF